MTPMRAAALACLQNVQGAFLRCDRGEALYVTNAPARTDACIDWAQAGFTARHEGKLTFLTPDPQWLERFVCWAEEQVETPCLSRMLHEVCFGGPDEEDMRLWIEGIKRLEMKADAADYEKLVRQRAADCLRNP